MAVSAAARPGSAQIICSATLFAFAQSNEALPDPIASLALAARTKASASAIPPHVEENPVHRPLVRRAVGNERENDPAKPRAS
jgi:hypothetical protein